MSVAQTTSLLMKVIKEWRLDGLAMSHQGLYKNIHLAFFIRQSKIKKIGEEAELIADDYIAFKYCKARYTIYCS